MFDQALLTHGSWAYFCYILYTKLDLYTQRNEHYGTRDILAVISGKNEMVSVYIFILRYFLLYTGNTPLTKIRCNKTYPPDCVYDQFLVAGFVLYIALTVE